MVVTLQHEDSRGLVGLGHQDRPAPYGLLKHYCRGQSLSVDLYALAWRYEAVRLSGQAIPECGIALPLANLARRRRIFDGMDTLKAQKGQGCQSDQSQDRSRNVPPGLTSV
jgi:hypothetical protein